MSKVYQLRTIQRFPMTIDDTWDFFSRPENLKDITPRHLRLTVISDGYAGNMYAGQIIEYRLRPFLGATVYWMTEITHVEEKKFFVDEQRYGPYSFWHHQHHFNVIEGGVEMIDVIHYKIPFWFIGDLANKLFVHSQLSEIFSFRYKVLEQKLGKWQDQKRMVHFDK